VLRYTYIAYLAVFSLAPQPKSGPDSLIVKVFKSHTITHTHTHTNAKTPLNKRSGRRKGHYLHETQQTQQIKAYALSGIRTLDHSHEAPQT